MDGGVGGWMGGWINALLPYASPHREVFSQQGGSREGARSLRHRLPLLHLRGKVGPVSGALYSGGTQKRLTTVGLGFHFYNRPHAHPLLHSGKMGAPRWPEHRTVTITEHTDPALTREACNPKTLETVHMGFPHPFSAAGQERRRSQWSWRHSSGPWGGWGVLHCPQV